MVDVPTTSTADVQPHRRRAVMSVPEAASYLGVNPRTVYRMVAAGELPVLMVRSRRTIPIHALDRWIDDQTRPGKVG